MSRPKILDLYACAGGAGEGYRRAGYDVYAVDIEPQPRNPFPFRRDDAIHTLQLLGAGLVIEFRGAEGASEWLGLSDFAAIHASPPCHDHSALAVISGPDGTAWLLAATRELLIRTGLPWVMENVPGADMENWLQLCGSQFGLHVWTEAKGDVWLRRHRLFESSVFLMAPGEHSCAGRKTIGVYGTGDGGGRGWKGSFKDRQAVMGIDWMRRDELSQALPPAYTEWIGSQLLSYVSDPVSSPLPTAQGER